MPPGFDRGLVFEADGVTLCTDNTKPTEKVESLFKNMGDVVNVMDLIKQEEKFLSK